MWTTARHLFGVLENIVRGREWKGKDEELGDIQGWGVWPRTTTREPKSWKNWPGTEGKNLLMNVTQNEKKIVMSL